MAGEASLHGQAHRVLMATDPSHKIALGCELQAAWRRGVLGRDTTPGPLIVDVPGRPLRPRLVSIRELPKRGLGSSAGRAALVHAVAHIEFNAINLGWDAVYRFRGLPDAFYDDWISVAIDEGRHFQMLDERLRSLGYAYGQFEAHDGLWTMARRTAHDLLHRMALVPRVLEARGLDVTPGMLSGLRSHGDLATEAILQVILREEVGHVAIGSRWYRWCCEQRGLTPDATFRQLLRDYGIGTLKPPLNLEARRQAGFGDAELDRLQADMRGVSAGTRSGRDAQ